MPREKKSGRRSYLNDFSPAADGNYVYNGTTHAFQENGEDRKKALARLWRLAFASALCVLASGCVPAAGMLNCAYVILPYVGCAFSVISVIWLMSRLSGGGDPLRDYVYKATVEQYKLRSMLVVAFAGLSLACEGLYLILNGVQEMLWGTVAFWLCQGAAAGFIWLWRRCFSRLAWKKAERT